MGEALDYITTFEIAGAARKVRVEILGRGRANQIRATGRPTLESHTTFSLLKWWNFKPLAPESFPSHHHHPSQPPKCVRKSSIALAKELKNGETHDANILSLCRSYSKTAKVPTRPFEAARLSVSPATET